MRIISLLLVICVRNTGIYNDVMATAKPLIGHLGSPGDRQYKVMFMYRTAKPSALKWECHFGEILMTDWPEIVKWYLPGPPVVKRLSKWHLRSSESTEAVDCSVEQDKPQHAVTVISDQSLGWDRRRENRTKIIKDRTKIITSVWYWSKDIQGSFCVRA